MKKTILLSVLSMILIFLGCTDQEKTECDLTLSVELKDYGNFIIDISAGVPPYFKTINIKSIPKDPAGGLGGLQDVELEKMVVIWSRADGGTIVPQPYTMAWTVVVPAGGQSTLNNPPVMAPDQLLQMPFLQLLPENGGRDLETGRTLIQCNAEIIFYGHTLNGCPIESQHATALFQFYYGGGR